MARAKANTGGAIYGINVTPLVDIMLVLLITFMLTAVIDAPPATDAIGVDLPRAASGSEPPPATLSIVVPAAGPLRLDGADVTSAELAARAAAAVRASDAAQAVVAADRAVAYDRVVEVVDTVRRAGIVKLALAVEGGGR